MTVLDQPMLFFPAVTICNHNQFRRSVAEQSPEISRRLQQLFSGTCIFQDRNLPLKQYVYTNILLILCRK